MKKIVPWLLTLTLIVSLIPSALALQVDGSAPTQFIINGATVEVRSDNTTVIKRNGTVVYTIPNSVPNDPVGCSNYVRDLTIYIWETKSAKNKDKNQNTNYFQSPYNMLRNKTNPNERTVTEEHVREFIQAAPLGAKIRVNDYKYAGAAGDTDNCWGHSMFLVAKDNQKGTFTTLEGGGGLWVRVYTYRSFAETYNQRGYKWFFRVTDMTSFGTDESGSAPAADLVITKPDNGLYALVPACAPNSALDVENKRTDNKANLHIWQRGDNWSHQQWNLERVDGDYYKITNENSDRVISIQGDSTASESNVWQYGYGASNAQKWRFEEAGDGYYYIVPKINTDLCLDVSSASSTNGTNVQVYKKNQTNAQKWKLVPVEKEPETYTLYFDANGGTVSTSSKVCTVWEKVGKLPTPTREGYKFRGWVDSTEGFMRLLITDRMIWTTAEDRIAYADWEKIEPAPTTPTPAPETPEPLQPVTPSTEPEPPVTPSPEPEKKWHFTKWSDWSDVEYTPSGTREVETRRVEVSPAKTQYRYGNFTIGGSDIWDVDYGYSLGWKGTVKENWTEWRDTPIPYVNRKTFCSDTSHNHQHVKSYEVNGWATWYLYREDGIWDGWSRPYYYWEETRTVEATYKTQYRYRDWIEE